jgi:ElaB/YqjD/DUF883 family membrane-anchored ribosome-binding protein
MSDLSDEFSPPPVGDTNAGASSGASTKDTATDQAKQVKDQAVDTTKQVAGVAAEQAQNVAAEAKTQTRNVVHEARQQLTDQASTQQNNLASWLFNLVDELEQMVGRTQGGSQGSDQGSAQPGVATSLVRQASERAHGAATWLQDHEPQDLLAETGRFARRRPGMFLALALAGGVLAGRLTRGLTADSGDDASSVGSGSGGGYAGAYQPVSQQPVTYGTGSSLTGSGALPPASGYVGAVDDVDTLGDVEPYGDIEPYGDVRPAGTYPVVDPVEDLDPLRPEGRRDLDDDAGLR